MTLPPRFADLKRSIASSYPDFEARATNAWNEIIAELDKVTRIIKEEGLNVSHDWLFAYDWWGLHLITLEQYIPQISFDSLDSLSQDEIEKIKRRGSVLIRDVVDDAQAAQWKDELKEFVKVNDERGVEGTHSSKRIYKNVIYHLNQVPPLTTSNSSMSCTLKSLLFQTFTLTCRIDLAGLNLRFKRAHTPIYSLLPLGLASYITQIWVTARRMDN